MKSFFKYLFATVIGIMLAFFLTVAILVAVVFASEQTPEIKAGSVLELKLSGNLVERSEPTVLSILDERQKTELALDDVLESITKAKDNENIEGILLSCGWLAADFASLEEIRSALADFKLSGKFVAAYSGAYSQKMYYLATVADSIFLNPKGVVELKGIASKPVFYKGLLDKLGIEMQVVKAGSYKSFAEQYTSTKMSDENRTQLTQLGKSIWNSLLDGISAERGIPADVLNTYADRFTAFEPAEKMLEYGLVDALAYHNELIDYLNSKSSTGKAALIGLNAVKQQPAAGKQPDYKIAVVYANGEINDSDAQSISSINAARFVKMLEGIRCDSLVKAVVLRINSPGGSAYGSEQIWHALNRIREKKPVIASMGGVAASGGYYIAAAADTIIAQSTTITGSIGVFGIIPGIEGLAEKIGVSFDVVKTNPMADFPAVDRALEPGEQAALQHFVDRTYALFIDRTAESRKMSRADVELLAQGRVWSGADAVETGLVDGFGSLKTAIDIARERVNVPVKIEKYPKLKENFWADFLAEITGGYQTRLLNRLGAYTIYEKLQDLNLPAVQARMPFDILMQ